MSANIEPTLALALAKSPALERLRINTFKSDRPVPTAMDYAISLSFELYELGLPNGETPPSSNVRHFAVDIRRTWLSGVIKNVALRKRFQSARDEHPAKFITVDSSCLEANGLTLEDVDALRCRYFESFAAPDATEIVCVWLPDLEGIVHYDPLNSRVVEIALNTSIGADRGFFRVGYDYSIKRSGDRLHVCFLNTRTKMEAGHFGQYCVGRATSTTLWAR
ncbi:hypothetical protein [Pseudomonas abieticivorans]|uniref:hypothetical protein n=1 Tax=Pseudomonas abieticivorans TaxID=2931382 RepID=UPI0020BE5919|nr:hypothetical protein [Pseudomonas sp. PIA16]